MEINRVLAAIHDFANTYKDIRFSEMPPQYVVYEHQVGYSDIFKSDVDILHMLEHNVLADVDMSEWGSHIEDAFESCDNADGMYFFAIIQLEEDTDETLLVSYFDREDGQLKSYMSNLDFLNLREAETPFFFMELDLYGPRTLH